MKISVIIPVYNDPRGLETTVRSLIDQSENNYEVIIVDNNSTDKTTTLGKKLEQNHEKIKFAKEDEIQGSYAARNTGIKASNGEILCFIDADMWVEYDYIESVRTRMNESDCLYLGCRIEIVPSNGGVIENYKEITAFPVEKYIEEKNFCPTSCLVVSKKLIEELGYFDHRLISGGDYEYGNRVKESGYKQVYEPSIILYHPARNSLRSVIKKHVRVGRGMMQLQYLSPSRFQHRSLFHPFNYMPPKPDEFYDDYHEYTDNKFELVYWFLLEWVINLSDTYGGWKEVIKSNR